MDDFIKHIPTFIPNSALGSEFPLAILKGIERFPYALDELGKYGTEWINYIPIEDFNKEKELAEKFRERFVFHRTDKHSCGYHLIYGQIFFHLGIESTLNILEIGIGTNNNELISHMGENETPGASLRAFRDLAKNSMIYGADIDHEILFEEERIKTTVVDQLIPHTFKEMSRHFGNIQYDLIIDDGLHSVSANLHTLLFGLSVLKKDGWIMIEDIGSHKVCWNTIYRLLPSSRFNKIIVQCKNGPWIFLLQRKK